MINEQEYRNKVLGCWLGKNIGGTLGAPFEWRRQVNNVNFYVQDLKGEPLPNDDLDIQLLWLCALEEKGNNIDSHILAEYWCSCVTPHWAEYGAAKANMRSGLLPPLSGWNSNPFRHSCGSFIRSEIWACITPGQPEVAAKYAYEDAIIDHGNGEGVYAEVFMAALESAAFIISDLRELIDIGLSYIPAECGVARAVKATIENIDNGKTWLETRDAVLHDFRSSFGGHVSEEDEAKGFRYSDNGDGYDAPANIAITIAGLLYGGDDFGEVQCICVNMGEDTDCTAATSGSIWGIIHGAEAIPQKWIEPIGRGIKTVSLNLGDLGEFGGQIPADVDNLTERTINICRGLWQQRYPQVEWLDFLTLFGSEKTEPGILRSSDNGEELYSCITGTRFKFDQFFVDCDYIDGAIIRQGQPKKLRIKIKNKSKIKGNMCLHWYLPEGWKVSPATDSWAMCWNYRPITLEYELTAEKLNRASNRAVLEITCEGCPTVMLIPVTLLSASINV